MYTLLPYSGLRITGADRMDFTTGQMTAHLKAATAPSRLPSLFLNVRGQIEFWAQTYRREKDLYIHLAAPAVLELKRRLERYIVFDQVGMEDLSSVLTSLHVTGADHVLLESLGYDMQQKETQETEWNGQTLLISKIQRTQSMGFDIHCLSTHQTALIDHLRQSGQTETDWTSLQKARIEAGLPDPYEDGFLGQLPQECGMDWAVSYQKGCYIGQEIMARLDARGEARHRLVSLEGDIASHTDIFHMGKRVGKTGLCLSGKTLAILRKDVPEGSFVEVAGKTAKVLGTHEHAQG